jgi:hypothetical protein
MIKALGTTLFLTGALAMGSQAQAKTVHHHHNRGLAGVQAASSKPTAKPARSRARTTSVAPAPSQVRQGPTSAYSAQISWPAVPGATRVTISVNGQLVDRVAADPSNSYQLQQLWPSTNFAVTVQINGSTGQQLARYSRTVTTAARTGAFPRLYSDSAFVNQPVPASPSLDSNSSAIASEAISHYGSSANLVDNADWGIPVVSADAQSSTYNVGCQYYWCDQNFGQLHIPANAAPNTGSDGHMVVLQPNGDELDMWVGQHTSQGWSAGERWVESANGPATNCTVVHQCGGADAANFALGAGLVRPEEIAQGHIDHALAITTPDTRQGYIACPATNGDGTHSSPDALPIGAHVQLDPSINVAQLNVPAWQKVIATALQKYGAYVTDTGGSIGVYAQSNQGRSYDAWAKAGVSAQSPSLADLPWNQMRVLDLNKCG